MKKALFIPAVIVVMLAGCHPEENPEQLKAVNQSLEYANKVLQDANDWVYEKLAQDKKDPQTANFIRAWNSRAKQIRQYADSIKASVRGIKIDLIKQSDSLKRDYVDLTKQLHNADGIGGQLLNKLTAFKDSIPAVFYWGDTMAHHHWEDQLNYLLKTIPLLPAYRDSLPEDRKSDYKKKWLEKSFGRTSALMAMIMLNKIESDVLATENACIECFKNQIGCGMGITYDRYSAIASLSSSFTKAGEPIELTVGMGSFTDDLNPRITIDGEEVKINDDALLVHKFIAKGAPGIHTIQVKVEYTKPDGSKGHVWKILKYTIAEN